MIPDDDERKCAVEQAISTVRSCPKCGTEDTYAFMRVSNPAQRADGTYAVCAACRVHWQLSPTWIEPDVVAKDYAMAVRISNNIIQHSTLVPASAAFRELAENWPRQ